MSTHAELQTSRRQLFLQHRQLLPLLLRQRQTRTSTVLDHLLHKPRLLGRELPPRGLDVPLRRLLRAEDVEAHGDLDAVLARQGLGAVGCIAELLGGRDVLVEGERLDGVIERGLCVGECDLWRDASDTPEGVSKWKLWYVQRP